jgi:outer membrane protein OmpA-like peptidoglycan-associated protein
LVLKIYFDFDKSNIRVEAALDLEKILDVMNQYQNET